MVEYLYKTDDLERIVASLKMKPRIFAFDFDGTLAPIASTPADVVISGKMIELLEKMSHDPQTVVAIVSGRSHQDVAHLIGIPSIIYFGNHGVTASVDGYGADKQKLSQWSADTLSLYTNISYLEQVFVGCIIENKGPVLSIHYRNVDLHQIGELISFIQAIVSKHNVRIMHGKMVLEVQPVTPFTKGTALAELASKNKCGWHHGQPFLFIGDDATDEDGFTTMNQFGKNAFGFKIGDGDTYAHFRLSESEVVTFMENIL